MRSFKADHPTCSLTIRSAALPVIRLGKPVEHLQAALRATFAPGPASETVTTVARQVAYFGYLSYDVLVWVCTHLIHHLSNVHCSKGKLYKIHQSEPGDSKAYNENIISSLVRRNRVQSHQWGIEGGRLSFLFQEKIHRRVIGFPTRSRNKETPRHKSLG